jgi:hypothetical protein
MMPSATQDAGRPNLWRRVVRPAVHTKTLPAGRI